MSWPTTTIELVCFAPDEVPADCCGALTRLDRAIAEGVAFADELACRESRNERNRIAPIAVRQWVRRQENNGSASSHCGTDHWTANREGHYPSAVAIPLGLLISRLRTPPLAIAVFSCVLHVLARRVDPPSTFAEAGTPSTRMSTRQFRERLTRLGLSVEDWARLTGVRRQRVLRWCHDEERILAWVPVLTAALAAAEPHMTTADPDKRDVAISSCAAAFDGINAHGEAGADRLCAVAVCARSMISREEAAIGLPSKKSSISS